MLRKSLAVSFTLSFAVSTAMAAAAGSPQGNLSAADIANKNVTARGGLQAWREVQAISLVGKLGAGGNQRAAVQTAETHQKVSTLATDPRPAEEVQLPFLMEMQRPRRTRFELQFKGQTAVQVFDGANGWKLRPFLNRRDVEPYTADETKVASMQAELDGPLVDYAIKGTRIELEGLEKVEDRDTYRLKLTMKNGQAIHVWINAQTFLEAKIEGQSRRLDGIDHPVEVYYRDYRSVNGLQIPFVLETKVLPGASNGSRVRQIPVPAEKIIIEKVAINPKFDATLFSRPEIQTATNTH